MSAFSERFGIRSSSAGPARKSRKRRRSVLDAFVGYIEDTIPQLGMLLPKSSSKVQDDDNFDSDQSPEASQSGVAQQPRSAMKRRRREHRPISEARLDTASKSAVKFQRGKNLQQVRNFEKSGPASAVRSRPQIQAVGANEEGDQANFRRALRFDDVVSSSKPNAADTSPDRSDVADVSGADRGTVASQGTELRLHPVTIRVAPGAMMCKLLPRLRRKRSWIASASSGTSRLELVQHGKPLLSRHNDPQPLETVFDTFIVSKYENSAFGMVGRRKPQRMGTVGLSKLTEESVRSTEAREHEQKTRGDVSIASGDDLVSQIIRTVVSVDQAPASKSTEIGSESDEIIGDVMLRPSRKKRQHQSIVPSPRFEFAEAQRLVSPGKVKGSARKAYIF